MSLGILTSASLVWGKQQAYKYWFLLYIFQLLLPFQHSCLGLSNILLKQKPKPEPKSKWSSRFPDPNQRLTSLAADTCKRRTLIQFTVSQASSSWSPPKHHHKPLTNKKFFIAFDTVSPWTESKALLRVFWAAPRATQPQLKSIFG